MPRAASATRPRRTRAARHNAVWRTAAIAPPRPSDLAAQHLLLPRDPRTPAELFFGMLKDGCGRGMGEEGPDTRPNIQVRFWVDCKVPLSEPHSFFEDEPVYTLKVTLAPVLFIRPLTVSLEAWTGSDVEAPGAPLWLRELVDVSGAIKHKTFVRVYRWIHHFVRALFATPDIAIPEAQSWFKMLDLLEHIASLYRPKPQLPPGHRKPKPRPVRRAIGLLEEAFQHLALGDRIGDAEGRLDVAFQHLSLGDRTGDAYGLSDARI